MSVQVAKRCFTVAEYNRMGETGILTEDDRVELIGGEIVEISPIGRRHAACVGRPTNPSGRLLADGAIVWIQNPIVLNDYTEPQPDVALLGRREDFYEQSLPAPEAWVVNLHDEEVEVYTRPAGGAYQDVRRHGRGEALKSADALGLTLNVDEILG
ncbi:MAG TPA: Uma2 family endonuclease [Pyrinomonadaceae bacterium]|nr:Uma2 family endonuclease [Pyrinomonadaceae bacterium]